MERALTRFVRALRSAGAEVSTAEAIDAARALALVGYDDRASMKAVLGIALAKSDEEKVLHDNLFELYFSRPASDAHSSPLAPPTPAVRAEAGDPSPSASCASDPGDAQGMRALVESGDAARIAAAIERAGAAAGVDEIRFASQTAYFVRRMLEQLGVDALERRLSQQMRARTRESRAEVAALVDARARVQRLARAYVDQRFEVFGRSATEAFMNEVATSRAIGSLSLRDIERMKAVVARMAKRLAIKHARRRHVRNRGQLDIRRTLRASAGSDGVPFDLVWRRKRKDRPSIVAICDVSGSVAAHVRFLLLFLYALQEKITDLRAFAFSNHLVDVGRMLETLGFEAAMSRIIEVAGSGSTDYGQALEELQAQHWDTIDRRTTVLVLGDGRANFGDPRLDIFQQIAERAKRVVWLCPEQPARWGSGDSCMLQYQPFCSPLSYCSTAADLESAVDDILMAYD